jgi:ABC-type oligopeptide transport system substrate-binding subunit
VPAACPHTYKSDEENLAALLDGEIDLLVAPLYSGLDAIQRNPDLKLVYRPKLFTAFFGFDEGSAELRTSNVKGRNPLKDKRVRQAVAHAIDMEPALRPVMGELFFPERRGRCCGRIQRCPTSSDCGPSPSGRAARTPRV